MNLKKFRFDYNLSQSDLATIFRCTQAHVSSIEKGTRSLTDVQLQALVDKFGYDVVHKYDDEDVGEEPAPPQTEITGNTAPVQNGNANLITSDDKLVEVVLAQSRQITKLLDHQERLITMLEQKQNGTD